MDRYSQSQYGRVHPASGRRGTVLPRYSMPLCDCAASHASDPGEMQTLRSRPSLCAFRKALSERAMSLGVLCIGALQKKRSTMLGDPDRVRMKFSLTVSDKP